MTTAAKPLPPHGTYARGNGSPGRRPPCPCPPCREAKLKTRKRLNVARQLGRAARVDATPALEHLRKLRVTMSWSQIQAATGCDDRGLQLLISGQRTEINRTTQDKILAVAPGAEPSPGMYIDATGPRRRLQALSMLGYSGRHIAILLATSEKRVHTIANGSQPSVRYGLVRRINDLYDQLSQTPAPAGRSRTRVIRHALDNRWAPPSAWDDDTIDDPTAVPDWTGYCGTDRGWWLHRLEKIPACPACETAHTQWKAERAHLTHNERWAELGKARTQARTREADLAADARELLAYDVGIDQAAERLGVTRQHLQQAMLRHPAAEAVAA
ncbi:hypothetical protein [Streptomyces prasinopilosus]|uniref:hypothetical protein n=1 Tax=Streptomyces prasinopilosus TaxID=67344 RepID=UPI0006EB888D|nr:hypothetical protein [Streptomyces prasinopilosus]